MMEYPDEHAPAPTGVAELDPYGTLKQIIEDEAVRAAAQQTATQERVKTPHPSERIAPHTARDTVRYGLD